MKILIDQSVIDQALELLDKQWKCNALWSLEEAQDVADELRQAKEQAQQAEPAAKVIDLQKLENESDYETPRIVPLRMDLKVGDLLYTAPPPCQPLTDEQVHDLMEKNGWLPTYRYAYKCGFRDAEAAHGIKEKKYE